MFLYGVEVRFYGGLLFKFYFGTFQTKFFGHFKRDLIDVESYILEYANDIIENQV